VTQRRSWAALATLCSALVLAAAAPAAQPAPAARPPDAGAPARARDAGPPLSAALRDGGTATLPLGAEDLEVVENLELLEHLQESEVLDLLLPLRDE
jgi:hypothetical protein